MKKFALICLFATLAFGAANAQEVEKKDVPANGAKIRFTEMEHQYGTLQKGGNGDCEFEFWNDGNEPLILSNVKASCGCTTPSYTQKPVMPGEKGAIKVHYNTNNVGAFSKTVTVTSNAVDNPRVVLRIKGNVQAADQAQPEAKPMTKPELKPVQGPKPEVKSDMKPMKLDSKNSTGQQPKPRGLKGLDKNAPKAAPAEAAPVKALPMEMAPKK